MVTAQTVAARPGTASYGEGVPPVIWFTGLPGAGKTTIGRGVVVALDAVGVPAVLIDGDDLRARESADLGFDRAARLEQARRAARIARDVRTSGRVAVVTTISPYREGRAAARALLAPAFIEVHVDAPAEVCEARDPKGLYRRARDGEILGLHRRGRPVRGAARTGAADRDGRRGARPVDRARARLRAGRDGPRG